MDNNQDYKKQTRGENRIISETTAMTENLRERERGAFMMRLMKSWKSKLIYLQRLDDRNRGRRGFMGRYNLSFHCRYTAP